VSARQESGIQADGRLWLEKDTRPLAGRGRIALLRHISATGSISAAARAVGMSYKAAWDAVDAMNNLAEQPLVERRAGGLHGGGTRVTDYGTQLIRVYEKAEAEYRRFLTRLSGSIADFDHFHDLMEILRVKTSARNQLRGIVTQVSEGAVNAEVTLDVNGTPLVAIITNESARSLGLKPGIEAYALIKASWVILSTEDGGLKTSARNRLCGTIERLTNGAVNSEVVLALDGGARLAAILTIESVKTLGLTEGMRACALIKAPHVIIAVQD
jgi:molybdate transport system regulatory protein